MQRLQPASSRTLGTIILQLILISATTSATDMLSLLAVSIIFSLFALKHVLLLSGNKLLQPSNLSYAIQYMHLSKLPFIFIKPHFANFGNHITCFVAGYLHCFTIRLFSSRRRPIETKLSLYATIELCIELPNIENGFELMFITL